MTARMLDGKAVADEVRSEVAHRVRAFVARRGVRPRLAAVLVGDDPASRVYVKNKRSACEKAGVDSSLHCLPASAGSSEASALVEELSRDPAVHGILVQLPLPDGFDESAVIRAIDPRKDVDGLHPFNVGLIAEGEPRFLPCTPFGVQQLLARCGVEIPGRRVVVVGRSNLVGTPLALMLSRKGPHADATVTLCHSRTRDLPEICRQAEILVAAIGRPEFLRGDMIRPGAVVVDVGINRLADGRIVGDVHFDSAVEVAGALSPVPGGVGRMTVAMLLANTLRAAELQCGGDDGSTTP